MIPRLCIAYHRCGRDRITNAVFPATVTRLAARIAQMESQIHAPLLSDTITSAFPGFQRSMTYKNDTSSGHDPTHFHDDRASIFYIALRAEVFKRIDNYNYSLLLLPLNRPSNQHLLNLYQLLLTSPAYGASNHVRTTSFGS